MGRRIEIVDKITGRSFPYEVGDRPVVADHVADAWVRDGFAEELEDSPEPETEPEEADEVEEVEPEPRAQDRETAMEPRYRVETRSVGGWADVVGPDGDAVNDKALRPDDAEALAEELNAEDE